MKSSADRARRRVRLVRRPVARRQDRLLRHRRPGADLRRRHQRPTGGKARLVATLEAAWVTALAGPRRRHADRGHDARRARLHVDPKSGQVEAVRDAPGGARLGAGARRARAAPSTPAPAAREDLRRSTPSGKRAQRLGLGRQARRVAARGGRQAPLRRHLRGGNPLQGRRSTATPRRSPTSTRRRSARSARPGGAIYVGGQRLRAVRRDRRRPRRAPPPRRAARKITIASSGSPASAGCAAAPGPAQGQGRALPHRSRRPHGADVLDPRRLLHRRCAFDEGGRAYVGTGSEGRVYRVCPDRTAALAIDVPERQALALLRAGNGFLVGTGDVGGVYRAAPAAPRAGDLPVARARRRVPVALGPAALARHARRRDREPLRQHRQARRDLDRLRSAREAALDRRRAASASRQPARALRPVPRDLRRAGRRGWRRSTLAYLPQNQRARITELGPATAAARPRSAAGWDAVAARRQRRRARAPAVIKLRWKVENPDGDELGYRLAFRAGERRRLAPAGRARSADQDRLRLEHRGASRRDLRRQGRPPATIASVPRELALDTTFTSSPILVDNRKPEVLGLAVKYPVRVGPRARRPEPAGRDGVRDRRRRLAGPVAPPTASATTWSNRSPSSCPRSRPGRTRSPSAPGTAPTTSAPAASRSGRRANDCARPTTTRPGSRPRPRSCRSRSACCRTSARSSAAPRRATPPSSIRPGRSTACCAKPSGST